MEIDKNFILLKITQHEQGAKKLHEDSIYNMGAAEGLRKLLQELEELEKQEPITAEELIKNAKFIGGQNGST